MGSIKKTKSGKYHASAYDMNGVRHRKTFDKINQARSFINRIENEKYNQKLIKDKLKLPDINFSAAIENFLITKANLKKKTISRYEYVFEIFSSFLEKHDIQNVDDFMPDHATMLLDDLMNNYPDPREPLKTIKAKPKTINMFLLIIRSFFNYEVEIGHISKSPMSHIKNLKVDKPHPEYYTEEELDSFFKQKMHDNYRFAFLGLLHTGLRINELINLTWDDIDLNNRLLYVRAKEKVTLKTDNAERIIPINEVLFDVIRILHNLRDSINDYVFRSIKGKQLRERRLLEVCKDIGAAAGIKGRVFLHKFRHTFATHLAKRRVPVEVIQKLLGHSSIEQSMVYLHIRSEDLHADVSLLNDLASYSPKAYRH